MPLPYQLQLGLIYQPQRDGRLSRPWCEIAQAEIRTCNLPITSPALYHTATSAPQVVDRIDDDDDDDDMLSCVDIFLLFKEILASY